VRQFVYMRFRVSLHECAARTTFSMQGDTLVAVDGAGLVRADQLYADAASTAYMYTLETVGGSFLRAGGNVRVRVLVNEDDDLVPITSGDAGDETNADADSSADSTANAVPIPMPVSVSTLVQSDVQCSLADLHMLLRQPSARPRYVVCRRANGSGGSGIHGDAKCDLDVRLAPDASLAGATDVQSIVERELGRGPATMSSELAEWLGLAAHHGRGHWFQGTPSWSLAFDVKSTDTSEDGVRSFGLQRLWRFRLLTRALFDSAACGQLFEQEETQFHRVVLGERASAYVCRLLGVDLHLAAGGVGVGSGSGSVGVAAQCVPACVLGGSSSEKAAFARSIAGRPSSDGWQCVYAGASLSMARQIAAMMRTFRDAAVKVVTVPVADGARNTAASSAFAQGVQARVLIAGRVVRLVWLHLSGQVRIRTSFCRSHERHQGPACAHARRARHCTGAPLQGLAAENARGLRGAQGGKEARRADMGVALDAACGASRERSRRRRRVPRPGAHVRAGARRRDRVWRLWLGTAPDCDRNHNGRL